MLFPFRDENIFVYDKCRLNPQHFDIVTSNCKENVYIILTLITNYCHALGLHLHFWAMGTFSNYDKKFQKSRINICFAVCILVFAPYLDIKLPLRSSGRELHVWGRGFGLLTHSGAMAKKCRSLRLIFALQLCFSNCSSYIY